VAASLLACPAAAGRADTWRADAAAGYAFLHDSDADTYPVGGFVSASRRIHRWLGAAAELSLDARSED
jgi:hypothetical protein